MLISKFENKDIEFHLKAFETKYCFDFPNIYRQFLLKYNGGHTPDTKFNLNRISSDITGFYGLGDAKLNFIFFEQTQTIENYLTDKVIPIASNSYGDNIFIGIADDMIGKIYFSHHDKTKNYKLLSEDFTNFIKNCKSKTIGYIRTIEERKQSMIENGLGDRITLQSIKGWQDEIDLYGSMIQEKVLI